MWEDDVDAPGGRRVVGVRPCRQPRMRNQNVCRMHGGKSPQALKRAEKRAVLVAAETERVRVAARWTLGPAVRVDPADALLGEVHATAGHVAWLRDRVRDLDPAALAWGTVEASETVGGPNEGSTQVARAEPSVWYVLYARERDRLVKVAAEAIKAGIEERRVRLAEQQGALVAEVIRRILGDLDLSDAQQERVPVVVPRHLRSITGGAA